MKLRLTQAGFENYTGQMGVVWFEDGLSTTDVAAIDGVRISAAIGATWEDGSAANVGQMYLNAMDVPAFVGMADRSIEHATTVAPASESQPAAIGTSYTQEQLALIADEHGINGLREIATPLNIKGTSIVMLIDAILKAQGTTKAE